MCHLGKQNLQHLVAMSTGMEHYPDFCFCKPCVYNRMKITPHKNLAKRGDYPMEYIYTDIMGPLLIVGYDVFYYWVTFLNDNIQLSETIPLVNKSNIFSKFQKFLAKHK